MRQRVGKHQLDAVFLIDLGRTGVVIHGNKVDIGILFFERFHHTLAADVIGKTAKRLCNNNVFDAVVNERQHFCRQQPAFAHFDTQADHILHLFACFVKFDRAVKGTFLGEDPADIVLLADQITVNNPADPFAQAVTAVQLAVGDVVVIEGSWSKYGNFNNDTQILSVEKSLIKAEKVLPSTPLPVEGGVVTVVLTVKGDDLAVEIPEDATWLTAGEPTIIGTSTFVDLTAAPNEGDPRSTTVDFKTTSKGQTYVATVTVEQKAGVIAEPEIATIASVLALEVDATVANGTVIEGVVISNAALGNLTSKKGMYVQDETGGLQLRFNADHEFAFGDRVKIDLSGAKFGKYNAAVQVSNVANEKVTVVSKGNAVQAKTVSVADFLANKYEGQYVAIEGVQVVEADLAKKFVEGGAHTSINLETVGGQNFIEFSSKYATYGATTVPQGSGTIKGISARNKDAIQLIFAQESDFAGLTGSRFVPGQEPEQPSSVVKTLTNAEICAALTSTSSSYVEYTIQSASGNWTVNASQLNTNTFLQCRGKKGGYIKTPAFDKDIKSVTIHFTTKKSVYPDNTYCVFPATWTAPTAEDAYPDTGNVGKAVTDGSQSLTIPVAAGNKQVYISIIGTYSYYLDHIDVAF